MNILNQITLIEAGIAGFIEAVFTCERWEKRVSQPATVIRAFCKVSAVVQPAV